MKNEKSIIIELISILLIVFACNAGIMDRPPSPSEATIDNGLASSIGCEATQMLKANKA